MEENKRNNMNKEAATEVTTDGRKKSITKIKAPNNGVRNETKKQNTGNPVLAKLELTEGQKPARQLEDFMDFYGIDKTENGLNLAIGEVIKNIYDNPDDEMTRKNATVMYHLMYMATGMEYQYHQLEETVGTLEGKLEMANRMAIKFQSTEETLNHEIEQLNEKLENAGIGSGNKRTTRTIAWYEITRSNHGFMKMKSSYLVHCHAIVVIKHDSVIYECDLGEDRFFIYSNNEDGRYSSKEEVINKIKEWGNIIGAERVTTRAMADNYLDNAYKTGRI